MRALIVALALALASAACAQTTSVQHAAPARTPDIHYVPTSGKVVDAMLRIAHVTAADVVYDLGSGDGRIVIAAAKEFGARGVGVELDPDLIKKATRNAEKAGVADRVRFVHGDFFKADLSDATVVTLYLDNSLNLRLEPKLKSELKAGARVVSHRFPMPRDWKPDSQIGVDGTRVYLWTIR
jgi:SAM-dependent methyltransferase